MEIYISLLRGINIGKKQIPMKELKAMYESLGFKNVQTYIQSGNVLFQYKKTKTDKLSQMVEKKVEETFGFDVRVLHLTIPDIEAVISENPFIRQAAMEKVYVAFLITPPTDEERLKKLNETDVAPDKFAVTDRAIYIYCDKGYGITKINNNFFEARLKVFATTRNRNTTLKLCELAKEMSR